MSHLSAYKVRVALACVERYGTDVISSKAVTTYRNAYRNLIARTFYEIDTYTFGKELPKWYDIDAKTYAKYSKNATRYLREVLRMKYPMTMKARSVKMKATIALRKAKRTIKQSFA